MGSTHPHLFQKRWRTFFCGAGTRFPGVFYRPSAVTLTVAAAATLAAAAVVAAAAAVAAVTTATLAAAPQLLAHASASAIG